MNNAKFTWKSKMNQVSSKKDEDQNSHQFCLIGVKDMKSSNRPKFKHPKSHQDVEINQVSINDPKGITKVWIG